MRYLILLAALAACTRPTPALTYETGTDEQAATSGVALDSVAWSFVPSGGAEVTQRSGTVTTSGAGRLLIAVGEMQHPGVIETISDTAGLSWWQVGTWTQDESNVGEGSETLTMFAAVAPTAITDTVTVKFGVSAGAGLGVWALINAGTPINFAHSSDPTFAAPAFTMTPQPGSLLLGGAVDVSGDCCLAWAPMANTTLRAGVGLYSNDYGIFWTTQAVAGGPVTVGTTKTISGPVDWGAIAVEVPFSGTPSDAGTPDAGTCSWVCQ